MRADSRDPVDAVNYLKEHLIFSNRKVTVNECDAEAINSIVLDKNLAQASITSRSPSLSGFISGGCTDAEFTGRSAG